MATTVSIDELSINTIRGLSIDMIQRANSGHPGTPLGTAPLAYTLWNRVMTYDPAAPTWPGRDRYVLSAGHASALLYSLIHLANVRDGAAPALTLSDLEAFRQLGSKCPGHPEYGHTAGVETTTGPLGQGLAASVGMAIAQRWLSTHYARPDSRGGAFDLFDYNVYAQSGDGCMMEGITSEAASLAGHLQLSNLCWIYDANRITIEGHTDIAFTEDVAQRFVSYAWNVIVVPDINDLDAVERAIHDFHKEDERPTLIIVHSHIGYGSPEEDSPKAHGEPLGVDGVKATKEFLGLPADKDFFVPSGVYDTFAEGIGARGATAHAKWDDAFAAYRAQYPDLATEIDQMESGTLPTDWESALPEFPADPKGFATRESSGKVLNAVAAAVPWLIGGSADLSPSTKTHLTFAGAGDFQPNDRGGRNLHFGVREHAAAAICNGLAVSKIRPYWSGFLIFSDYARGAIRLSALMDVPVLHIFTHDSIGVGEDGPTHEPVEQIPSLRALPGLQVFRPADANEVVETWRVVMQEQHDAVALLLSRQALPTFDRSVMAPASGVAKGAYTLIDAASGTPDIILIATGSEVQLAVAAHEVLAGQGVQARVVSMPCWELFEAQTQAYRDSVLPPAVRARVSIEMASTLGWERWVGTYGRMVGIDTFGASAPLKDLLTHFGFTVDAVVAKAHESMTASKGS